MRLYEFDNSDAPTDNDARQEGIANLIAVLNAVIEQSKNEDSEPELTTDALINMVKNTGVLFDYNALVDAYDSNTAVNNLIKNFSKENVSLIGSSEDELDAPADAGQDSQSAVSKIAKRVATRNL